MTNSSILIRPLNSKTTQEIVQRLFAAYGTITKIEISSEENGTKTARVDFATHEQALSSVEHMDGREILRMKVSVKLANDAAVAEVRHADSSTAAVAAAASATVDAAAGDSTDSNPAAAAISRQRIGEIVYERAIHKYKQNAAQITGMVVAACMAFKHDDRLENMLHDTKTIDELIEASFKKINI